ncbi:hypothetical protein Patl1_07821 [Pistacia atlantica]|uniref:Uncharacterized protein n=1 Tax=Pistacia atlantica TaxID=434234 RepID=A0ACC1AHM3_9ROSI|nr:hypothetical protein Patl1_07821 [Pistacia atlantica]
MTALLPQEFASSTCNFSIASDFLLAQIFLFLLRCLSFVLVQIVLSKVLLVGTKTTTYIGKPVVTNAAVHAVVEEQGLNPKVIVFKYKKKKNYRRNIGHRQPNTRIRITGITGYEDYPAVTLDSLQS